MSGHHRGLPPPAAMTLAQPPPVHSTALQPPPQTSSLLGQPVALQPQPNQQSQLLGQLPAPPQWQQCPDDSMRAWLLAKAEEEKRRQEEERTRQETLRLEQRRTEHDILRTSLQGGIPPPMVPIVFAGMGGSTLPQAALEWAQQYMYSQMQQPQTQPHQSQLLQSTSGPVSPEHRRDSQPQAYAVYPPPTSVPPTPGSAQGPHGTYSTLPPGSPGRPRHYSLPGSRAPAPGSTSLPAINTSIQGPPGAPVTSNPSAAVAHSQSHTGQAQASPSISFFHWEPPASHAVGSGSKQPATPSERFSLAGESPRKRKATGPQAAAPPPPGAPQRLSSPGPQFQHGGPSSSLTNPPPGRRRVHGHVRQRSDISLYRRSGSGPSRQEQIGIGYQANSPLYSSAPPTARDGEMPSDLARQQQQHQYHQESQQQHPPPPPPSRNAPHSVSSMLSEEPSPRNVHHHQSSVPEVERRKSPAADYIGSMRQRDNE